MDLTVDKQDLKIERQYSEEHESRFVFSFFSQLNLRADI